MNRQTENFFKGFSQFTDGQEFESEEELNEALHAFMLQYNAQIMQGSGSGSPETADDFLELAEEADNQKKALKYAKMALKLEPDNIDAQTAVAVHSASTVETTLEKLKAVYTSATEQMKEQGFLNDENIGNFWLITETRPYMRLLDTYADTLYNCGKMKLAAKILEEMIHLCESDNLGARYTLMHIYCHLCVRRRKNRICTEFRPHLAAQITAPKRRKTAVFHTATSSAPCGKHFDSIGFQQITRISE